MIYSTAQEFFDSVFDHLDNSKCNGKIRNDDQLAFILNGFKCSCGAEWHISPRAIKYTISAYTPPGTFLVRDEKEIGYGN